MYKAFISIKCMICLLLLSECIIGAWILVHKKMGYNHMAQLEHKNKELQYTINSLQKNIEKAQAQHDDVKMYSYFQEKKLRERLHRGQKDEIIFFY